MKRLSVLLAVVAMLGVLFIPTSSVAAQVTDPQDDSEVEPAEGLAALAIIPGFYPVDASDVIDVAYGIAIEPDTGHLLVSEGDLDEVYVLDSDLELITSMSLPPDGTSGALEVEYQANIVYVTRDGNTGDPGVIARFERTIVGGVPSYTAIADLNLPVDRPCGGLEVTTNRIYYRSLTGDELVTMTPTGGLVNTDDASSSGTPLYDSFCRADSIHVHDGEVFVADWLNNRIVVFTLDGIYARTIGTGFPVDGLDIDAAGNFWTTDRDGDAVRVFDSAGILLHTLDLSGSVLGQIDSPRGIRVTPSGDTFWVADLANDRVQVFTKLTCEGLSLTQVGTAFGDRFNGTSGPDIVHLGSGNDIYRGFGDDDIVCGGAGNDTIKGGAGNDTLVGQGGDDEIYGGGGADQIYGSSGDDALDGQGGTDEIYGSSGEDAIDGRGAADYIIGGTDNDTINGQNGADELHGADGDDTISGQTGPDTIYGEPGDDDMFGGNGNDTFYGGSGTDKCAGNLGNGDQADAATCEQTPGIEILF